MIWQGVGIALDRYVFLLLFFALIIGRFKRFIFDWFPFIFLWLSYDFLRGFADNLDYAKVHFVELIEADKLFSNPIPTVLLQQRFFNPAHLSWIDYGSTIIYFLHFALAESFAFLLWLYNKLKFREFVTAILMLSYGGWLTYILYPSAPPWLAEEKGLLSGVTKILNLTLQTFPEKLSLPTIYQSFNPNPVAALPSMHTGYPFLILLFAVNIWGKKGLLFLPYFLVLCFSIIYLGEHYLIDIIFGIIYAIAFFVLAKYILHNVKFHSWLKKMLVKRSV